MPSFEQNIRELQEIVRKLESNELSLEDSIKVFERGQIVSAECKKELDSSEARIEAVVNAGRVSERIDDITPDFAENNE